MFKLIKSYKQYKEFVKMGIVKKHSFVDVGFLKDKFIFKWFNKCRTCKYYESKFCGECISYEMYERSKKG